MNLHQAAAYVIPNIGEHRNRPLACVALDHPEYLVRLAEHGAPECPRGGQFHTAVVIVVERMRANEESDILGNRTLDPRALGLAAAELRSDGGLLGAGGKGRGKAGNPAKASTPSTPAAPATGSRAKVKAAGTLFDT